MLLQKYFLDPCPGSRHVFQASSMRFGNRTIIHAPRPLGTTNAAAYVLARVTAANTQRVQI